MYGKWPVVASLTVFMIVVIGRYFFGDATEDEIAAFHTEFPVKDACLSGAAERIAPCTSPNCYQGVHLFLDRCLEQAEGDKALFCENAGSFLDSQGRDIFDTHCKPHTKYETECEKLISYAHYYCSRIL